MGTRVDPELGAREHDAPLSIHRQASGAYSVNCVEGRLRMATPPNIPRPRAMCHKLSQIFQNKRMSCQNPPAPLRRSGARGGGAAPETAPASGRPPKNRRPGGAGHAHAAQCFQPNECAAEVRAAAAPRRRRYAPGGGGRRPKWRQRAADPPKTGAQGRRVPHNQPNLSNKTNVRPKPSVPVALTVAFRQRMELSAMVDGSRSTKNLLGALAPASDVAAWLYQSRVCESRFGPDAICAMKRRASMCRWSCPCLRTCLGRLSMSGVRSMPGPCAAGAVFDLVL